MARRRGGVLFGRFYARRNDERKSSEPTAPREIRRRTTTPAFGRRLPDGVTVPGGRIREEYEIEISLPTNEKRKKTFFFFFTTTLDGLISDYYYLFFFLCFFGL